MKKIQLSLILMIALIVLAACGNNNNTTESSQSEKGSGQESNSPAPQTEAKEDKEPVKLTFWGGVPAEAGPQKLVDKWNAANPDIQVEYIRFVNDDSGNLKLDTALMTGQEVDLFTSYNFPRVLSRQQSGAALNLSEFTDYDIVEKMGPAANDFLIDGAFYGLPTTKNVSFIWLNKDALEDAGLDIPYEWTWEDLREYAKALQTDTRWGFLQWGSSILNPLDRALTEEGYVVDGKSNFGSESVSYGLELIYKLMHEDKTTPLYGEQIATKMPVETMFLKGEGGMFHAGTWIFRHANNLEANPRDFQIAFAPVPRYPFQEGLVTEGGLGDIISINSKSEHKEEAWKFLKWYADEGILSLVPGGRIPASKDIDTEAVLSGLLKDVEHLYDRESLERVLFGDIPVFTRKLEQQVMDIRQEEVEKYFLQVSTLEETQQAIVERHEKFLSENK